MVHFKKKVEETSIQEIVNEDLIMSSFTNMLQWLLSLGKNDNLTFLRRSFLPPHTPLHAVFTQSIYLYICYFLCPEDASSVFLLD